MWFNSKIRVVSMLIIVFSRCEKSRGKRALLEALHHLEIYEININSCLEGLYYQIISRTKSKNFQLICVEDCGISRFLDEKIFSGFCLERRVEFDNNFQQTNGSDSNKKQFCRDRHFFSIETASNGENSFIIDLNNFKYKQLDLNMFFETFWVRNSKASNLLILILNDPEDFAMIFRDFWSYDVLNLIIIVKSNDGNFNSVVTASPFDFNGNCGRRVNLKRWTSCQKYLAFRDKSISFKTGDYIKPGNINALNYTGCNFTVTVLSEIYALPYISKLTNKTLALHPLALISQILNFNLILKYESKETQAKFSNETYVLERLLSKDIDTYVFCTVMTRKALKNLVYSHIFATDYSSWLVDSPDLITTAELLFRAFKGTVWIVMVFVGVSVVVILCLTVGNDWSLNFLIALSILLGLSHPFKPSSIGLRLLMIFYLLFSMNVTTVYQARFMSLLTVPKHSHGFIHTLEDLLESDYTILTGVLALSHFELDVGNPMVEIVKRRVKPTTMTVYERLIAITERPKMAANVLVAILDIYPHFKSKTKILKNAKFEYPVFVSYRLRKRHPLFEPINKLLLKIVESGFFQKWLEELKVSKWEPEKKKAVELSLNHLQGAFFLLAIGISVGILAFFGEVIKGRLNKPNKHGSSAAILFNVLNRDAF